MVDNNNWDDEHNTYLMGLWRIGNREDALYVFDKMCVPCFSACVLFRS